MKRIRPESGIMCMGMASSFAGKSHLIFIVARHFGGNVPESDEGIQEEKGVQFTCLKRVCHKK